MSVTIRDVARESGFSIASVSRAFSDSKTVSPETYQIIMDVAQKIGYKYRIRDSKDTNRAKVVMMVVGDILNQYFLTIVKGVYDQLNEQGIRLAIFNSDYDPVAEEELVQFANENKYDGVILNNAIETAGLISKLKKTSCPVVLVNRYLRSIDMNSVYLDNYRGGYLATTHLIEMGHRKIAHLAGPINSTSSQDRERGFRDAIRDHQLKITESAVRYGNLKKDTGVDFGKYFRNNLSDYTAVFAANDLMAVGFCESMIEAGFSIPADVSVVGFDDSPDAVSGSVKLTSIKRDPNLIGRTAAEMMIECLSGDELKPRKIVLPPELIVRNSVRKLAD